MCGTIQRLKLERIIQHAAASPGGQNWRKSRNARLTLSAGPKVDCCLRHPARCNSSFTEGGVPGAACSSLGASSCAMRPCARNSWMSTQGLQFRLSQVPSVTSWCRPPIRATSECSSGRFRSSSARAKLLANRQSCRQRRCAEKVFFSWWSRGPVGGAIKKQW